jgi:thioredoxin 2
MNDILQIACPHCHTLNRAPAQKLVPGVRGKCGQCGEALFEGKPVALDTGHFTQHADKSDLPLLVDFWAEWCGPCRQMAPQFEAAAGKLEPKVRLAKVDTDAEPSLAQRFGIQGIPTMVLIHRGREVGRTSGAMPASAIERWVASTLAT